MALDRGWEAVALVRNAPNLQLRHPSLYPEAADALAAALKERGTNLIFCTSAGAEATIQNSGLYWIIVRPGRPTETGNA